MGLRALKHISLKKRVNWQHNGVLFCMISMIPFKEHEKQKREAMHNLYDLKDIAIDAFESRKAELKGDGKAGTLGFTLIASYAP